MGAPQTLTTDAGDELVVLSRRDYDGLLARAGDEAAEERMTGLILAETSADTSIPEAVWTALETPGCNRLQILRGWRKLTQAELALASGVAQPNISALESGSKGFSAATLDRMAQALNVPMEVLKG